MVQDVKLGTGALGTADCKRTSELLSGSLQVTGWLFGLVGCWLGVWRWKGGGGGWMEKWNLRCHSFFLGGKGYDNVYKAS